MPIDHIPQPPFRLVGVDMFDHEEYGPYGPEYQTLDEARAAQNAANEESARNQPGGMSDRHYVRDATGRSV